MYCQVVEGEVPVEDGKCQKKFGSVLGEYTCPYKNSLVCPLKEKK
jgi:hypothetical protein